MYKGKDTCPGCGTTGEKKPRNTAKDLCRDCKSLLAKARETAKFEAQIPEQSQVVYLRFRYADYYLRRIKFDFSGDLNEAINDFAQLFLKSVELKYLERSNEMVSAKGVTATSCPWFEGNVKKVHWQLLEGLLETLDELYSKKILEVKQSLSAEKEKAFEKGQNLLINQINKDIIGESQQ
jgi:hypothetical protein